MVKARNRPIEPPKKPEAAPFFLSTIHRGGQVEPSFPEAGTAAALEAVNKGKREGDKSAKTEDKDEDVPDLPSAGGDDWSDEEGDDPCHSGEEDAVAVGSKRKLGIEGGGSRGPPRGRSRILKQIKTAARFGCGAPSRCKLADLLTECDNAREGEGEDLMEDEEHERGTRFGAVMAYLKTLPPPMVDVDMSSLCQGEWDGEGVRLVELAMQFLLEELRCVIVS